MNIFNLWNNEKQLIHKNKLKDFYVNPREIWFTKMGKNIGFEEDGKDEFLRPVLVIKKVGNLFFTVALTSRGKKKNRFYYQLKDLDLIEKNMKYKSSSFIILSQVKVMDKKRFTQHIGVVPDAEFLRVKQKLRALLL